MSLQIDFAPSSKPRVPVRLGIGAIMLVLILALTWSLTSETEAGLPPNNKLMPAPNRERILVKRWEALADGICDAAATAFLEAIQPRFAPILVS